MQERQLYREPLTEQLKGVREGEQVSSKQREKPSARGSSSYISSFVSQIDDLWDGWCSVVLCGIVLSWPTQRQRTLIISGACIEQGAGVVRILKRVQEAGGLGVVEGAPIKRDGDGLMTAEADGESHLPWRHSQNLHPEAREGRMHKENRGETEDEGQKRERRSEKRWRLGASGCTCVSELGLFVGVWF